MIGPQLRKLIKPTPKNLVSQVDKGFGKVDFIGHYDIIQMLLYHLEAPFSWSVGEPFPAGDDKEPVGIVGVLVLNIDGQEYSVAGVGSDKDAKKAESDALKRAAMKAGLGLELWAQEHYWLNTQIEKDMEV